MRIIKSLLIFILVAGFPARTFAAQDPAGIYSITRGLSANDFAYTGKVTVESKGRGLYYLSWDIPDSEAYRGLGLIYGDALEVAYSSNPDFGLVVYKVSGGKLFGDVTGSRQGMQFRHENLEGPAGLNGIYRIVDAEGVNGVEYSGTVEIRPFGEVYNLTWTIGEYNYDGVGILEGNRLVVGWGAGVGVIHYVIKGNELKGRWAASGANRKGVEDLALASPRPAGAVSPIGLEELTRNIERALGSINSMVSDRVLRYRDKGADASRTTDLIKSTDWYKKPGSAKSDSTTLYLPTGPERHVYITRFDGVSLQSYEILNDGAVKQQSFPAEEWEKSYTPGALYNDMKKRIEDGAPYRLEYRKDRKVYVLQFDSADEAVFEILAESWLPYSVAVFDQKNNAIVEKVWSNIKINPVIPDGMFVVPRQADSSNRQGR
jgi:outer membrane lipoprotein-sorting protein